MLRLVYAKKKESFNFPVKFFFSRNNTQQNKYKQAVNKNYGIIKKRLMIAL